MNMHDYLAEARKRAETRWPADVPREPRYPLGEISIGDHLRHWAAAIPDETAIAFYGTEITWAQYDEMSDRAAGWLESVGVRAGDRVGVYLPNSPQFLIAFAGIMKLGAVHVPINTMFKELELEHELSNADVSVLFVLDSCLSTLASVIDKTNVREVLVTSAYSLAPPEPCVPLPPTPATVPVTRFANAPTWDDLLAAERAPRHEVDLDALAALNYTGGTTGLPKGCEHTQRHMLYTAVTTNAGNGIPQQSVLLCHVPIFWIAGEDVGIIMPIVSGSTCVLLARWDAASVMAMIERYRVTMTLGTVDNYIEIAEHPAVADHDFSSLDQPLTMSFVARLSPEVRDQWRKATRSDGLLREIAFGMTETHTMDTSTYGLQEDDWDLRGEPGMVGLPMPGTDIAVVDPQTREPLPFGERGDIILRSPSVMNGYWQRPDATADTIRDGWLLTGDSGFIDESGCLHYLAREKDMIKVNGMSVFPSEVETFLCRHEAVDVAAVVPKADDRRGQIPVAFVKLIDGATVTEDELRDWAKTQMATYKVPVIRFVDEYPMTTTGKIKKAELAASTD